MVRVLVLFRRHVFEDDVPKVLATTHEIGNSNNNNLNHLEVNLLSIFAHGWDHSGAIQLPGRQYGYTVVEGDSALAMQQQPDRPRQQAVQASGQCLLCSRQLRPPDLMPSQKSGISLRMG